MKGNFFLQGCVLIVVGLVLLLGFGAGVYLGFQTIGWQVFLYAVPIGLMMIVGYLVWGSSLGTGGNAEVAPSGPPTWAGWKTWVVIFAILGGFLLGANARMDQQTVFFGAIGTGVFIFLLLLPQSWKMSFEGAVKMFFIVALLAIGISWVLGNVTIVTFDNISPRTNPAPMPSECIMVLKTMGLDEKTNCPQNRTEWRTFIVKNTSQLASKNWQKELEYALLGTCPEHDVKIAARGCQLNYGMFAKTYATYLDAKGKIVDSRWLMKDSTIWNAILLVGILGALNVVIGIAIRIGGQTLGKITATTIFAAVVAIGANFNVYPFFWTYWNEGYSYEIQIAIQHLMGIGFSAALIGPFVSLLTFGLGFAVGEITRFGRGTGFLIGGGLTIVAMSIAFASETIGLLPQWYMFLGIMDIMANTPGLDVNTAVMSVVVGGMIFGGFIAGPLGPIWGLASTLGSMAKGSQAAEKLGMTGPFQ